MNKKMILFICNGNIHRSVVAEYCFNAELKKRGLGDRFVAASRGLQGSGGTAPPKHLHLHEYTLEWSLTKPVLQKMGIDISNHVSTPVRATDIEQSAVIIAMDRRVLDDLPNSLSRQFPDQRHKMHLFLELERQQEDVPDCGGSSDPVLHQTVSHLIHRLIVDKIDLILSWAS